MEYICIKKCFYDNKLYAVGEQLTASALPNKHFTVLNKVEKLKVEEKKKAAIKAKEAEPKTYADLASEEAEALLIGKKPKGRR